MPRLKAFRIVNLLYNNQENIIPDMTTDLKDQSGYIYLENGGGKSVMIQLLCAPFMKRKADRDFKPNNKLRPFGDFFPTTSPTFLIMQFDKDEGSGSFNVGLMGCRASELKTKDYHLYTFIEEFSDQKDHLNEYQIQGLQNKKMTLDAAQKYFRDRERHSNLGFYNLADSEQKEKYFDRLSNLKISQREWKLIRDICQEESGMSSYREKYPKDKDLLFELILPMVEEHINLYLNGEGRIENIQAAFNKYLKNYREHKEDLKEYKTYKDYRTDLEKILQKEEALLSMREELSKKEQSLFEAECAVKNSLDYLEIQIQELEKKTDDLESQKREIIHEEISFEYHQKCNEKAELEEKQKSIETKTEEIDRELKDLERDKAILDCSRCAYDIENLDREISKMRTQIAKLEMDADEIQKKVNEKGREVYSAVNQKIIELKNSLSKKTTEQENLKKRLESLEETTKSLNVELQDYKAEKKSLEARIKDARSKEKKLLNSINLSVFSQTPQIAKNECAKLLKSETKSLDLLRNESARLAFNKKDIQDVLADQKDKLNALKVDEVRLQGSLESDMKELSDEKQKFEDIIKKSSSQNIVLDEDDLFDKETALEKVQNIRSIYESRLEDNRNLLRDNRKELDRLTSKNPVEIEKTIESVAREVCDFASGYEWLKNQENSIQLAENYPIIPYSIIVDTVKDRNAILESLDTYTRHLTPILTQEEARNIVTGKTAPSEVLVGKFDTELIDLDALEVKKNDLQESIAELEKKCENQKDYIDRLTSIYEAIKNINTKLDHDDLCEKIRQSEKELQDLKTKKLKLEETSRDFERHLKDAQEKLSEIEKQLSEKEKLISTLEELQEVYTNLIENSDNLQSTVDTIKDYEARIESYENPRKRFKDELERLGDAIGDLRLNQKESAKKLGEYQAYKNDIPGNPNDISRLIEEYTVLIRKNDLIGDIEDRKNQLCRKEDDLRNNRQELEDTQKKYNIRSEDITPLPYEERRGALRELSQKEEAANQTKKELAEEQSVLTHKSGSVETELNQIQERLNGEGFEDYIPLDKINHHDFKRVIREIEGQIKQAKAEYKKLSGKFDAIEKVHFILKERIKKLPKPENLNTDIPFDDLTEFEIKNRVDEAVDSWNRTKNSLDKGIAEFKKIMEGLSDKYKEQFSKNLKIIQKEINQDNVQDMYQWTRQLFRNVDSMIQNLQDVSERDQKYFSQFAETICDYARQIDDEIRKIDSYTKVDLDGKKKKLMEIKYPKLDYEDEWMTNRIRDWLFKIIRDIDAALSSGKQNEKDIIKKELTGEGILKNIMNPADIQINVVKVNDSLYRSYRWEAMQFSGGEGFAATFAVFIALCAYARSDEFSGRNKNKNSMVVIMDNPFGEAQNGDILRPLMQLMENVNFQFVAFSAISLPEILELFDCVHRLELVQCVVNGTGKTKNVMMQDGKRCTAMQDRDMHVTKQISMLD